MQPITILLVTSSDVSILGEVILKALKRRSSLSLTRLRVIFMQPITMMLVDSSDVSILSETGLISLDWMMLVVEQTIATGGGAAG